jgi:hypothetical protein
LSSLSYLPHLLSFPMADHWKIFVVVLPCVQVMRSSKIVMPLLRLSCEIRICSRAATCSGLGDFLVVPVVEDWDRRC